MPAHPRRLVGSAVTIGDDDAAADAFQFGCPDRQRQAHPPPVVRRHQVLIGLGVDFCAHHIHPLPAPSTRRRPRAALRSALVLIRLVDPSMVRAFGSARALGVQRRRQGCGDPRAAARSGGAASAGRAVQPTGDRPRAPRSARRPLGACAVPDRTPGHAAARGICSLSSSELHVLLMPGAGRWSQPRRGHWWEQLALGEPALGGTGASRASCSAGGTGWGSPGSDGSWLPLTSARAAANVADLAAVPGRGAHPAFWPATSWRRRHRAAAARVRAVPHGDRDQGGAHSWASPRSERSLHSPAGPQPPAWTSAEGQRRSSPGSSTCVRTASSPPHSMSVPPGQLAPRVIQTPVRFLRELSHPPRSGSWERCGASASTTCWSWASGISALVWSSTIGMYTMPVAAPGPAASISAAGSEPHRPISPRGSSAGSLSRWSD